MKNSIEELKYFAADTAHELRTPLATLKIQAQLALKTEDISVQTKALRDIITGIDECTQLIQQLLIFSHVTSEKKVLVMKKINLYVLTKEILVSFMPLADQKNILLEIPSQSAAASKIEIKGNDVMLRLLIRNIIDNAIRYTPMNGNIKLAVFRKKNSILLRCTDTGRGIPLKLHAHVFKRFYRIANTGEQGSGLGLAIVKEIADLHHAKIILDKPTSGSGLQLDVLFPAFSRYH